MDALLLSEMAKKYTHTTAQIRYKKTGKKQAVYFDVISTDLANPKCIFYKSVDGLFEDYETAIRGTVANDIAKVSVRDFEIEPVPDRKVFDWGGKTLVFSRAPNRQWRKGITPDNSTITDYIQSLYLTIPNQKDFKLSESRIKYFSLDILQNLFNDCYAKTFEKALEDIHKFGLVSRSISDKYWICSYLFDDKPYVLFRYETPIAYYNNKIDTLTCLSKVYKQEVDDFCKRLNLTFKVEV